MMLKIVIIKLLAKGTSLPAQVSIYKLFGLPASSQRNWLTILSESPPSKKRKRNKKFSFLYIAPCKPYISDLLVWYLFCELNSSSLNFFYSIAQCSFLSLYNPASSGLHHAKFIVCHAKWQVAFVATLAYWQNVPMTFYEKFRLFWIIRILLY